MSNSKPAELGGFVKGLGVFSFFLVAIALSVNAVQAEYIQPSEVEVQTKRYQPRGAEFSTGIYHYKVAWQGMPVGRAKIAVDSRFQDTRPYYHVRATAKTGKFIDVFYRLRHTSESLFEVDSLKPVKFVSVQKERRKEKIREVSFEDSGRIVSKRSKNGKSRDPIEFQSGNLTLDPISAAFVARGLPIELGTTASFDVFNGKHRYLISFLVEERKIISVGGRQFDAFKVVPSVQKLTDSKGEQRLKSAAVWITADEARDVVLVESNVLVGSVTASLEKFEPSRPGNELRAKLSGAPK